MSSAPRVTLRAVTPEDADLLFAIAADLDTWEERQTEPPAPMSRARFDKREQSWAESANGDAVGFIVEADGVAVGRIGFFEVDTYARHAELGIALTATARGRGIGTAAIEQLVSFAFTRHNLRRLHLELIASNEAALRAYEKAGFVLEGRLREHAWVRGAYEDVLLMGRLREEP